MSAARRARTRIRRVVAAVAGIGLVIAGVGIAAVDEQSAKAVQTASVLNGFDPANIIDDAVMFNGATMTAAQIQTFLNGKQPSCAAGATCLKSVRVDMPKMAANLMCKAMPAQSQATAAQVIAAVGRACNVSPQVILVMLQKEQTLVTGRMPYRTESVSLIYRKATGLGCPDTAACDPNKYGLFNQLYGVAYWLVRYTTPPGTTGPGWTSYSWFPVGKPAGVLYNPDYRCGAKTITIKNKATASLYYYTPYVPNPAAVSAGWGTGNSCSAYGNRNFYLYFTTWFGSTHTVVTGAINAYWSANRGTFGDPTGNAVTTSVNGGGTVQQFRGGTIYTSSLGTAGTTGTIGAKYNALGGPKGVLGWPRRGPLARPTVSGGGTAQAFQKGTIYASAAGTAAVLAPVYSKYGSTGYELGALGWPTADAVRSTRAGGATSQAFQRGRIVVAGASSAVVAGGVLAEWQRRGSESGELGWPTGDASTVTAHGSTGTVQPFQGGSVTVHGSTFSVAGIAASNYAWHGGVPGGLGWPTGAARTITSNGGGGSQRFQGGAIVWTKQHGARALTGRILSLWDAQGGMQGSLGWPVGTKHDGHGVGGTVTEFTNGRAYSSSAGAAAVRGPVLTRYLQKGATGGVLGWPTANAVTKGGVTVQTFQHGRITWTKAGGAKASRS